MAQILELLVDFINPYDSLPTFWETLEWTGQTYLGFKRSFQWSHGFQNWKADKPKQLIAADFGHAHTFGRAYYVATRFFDRSLVAIWKLFALDQAYFTPGYSKTP